METDTDEILTQSRSTVDSLINKAMKKYKYKLYGAILGDLAGQPFEFGIYDKPIQIHNPDSHITDDTLMTLASARSIIRGSSIEEEYRIMGLKYQGNYYGKNFKEWIQSIPGTVNESWGNGCLMRAAPFMYIEDPLPLLMESVMCSHRHTISIESVYRLYKVYKHGTYSIMAYDPKPFKKFEVRADKTADFCINLFARIPGTHNCILKAIECGGDTDTNASIVGELCNSFYEDITEEDVTYIESKLDPYLLDILKEYNKRF